MQADVAAADVEVAAIGEENAGLIERVALIEARLTEQASVAEAEVEIFRRDRQVRLFCEHCKVSTCTVPGPGILFSGKASCTSYRTPPFQNLAFKRCRYKWGTFRRGSCALCSHSSLGACDGLNMKLTCFYWQMRGKSKKVQLLISGRGACAPLMPCTKELVARMEHVDSFSVYYL